LSQPKQPALVTLDGANLSPAALSAVAGWSIYRN